MNSGRASEFVASGRTRRAHPLERQVVECFRVLVALGALVIFIKPTAATPLGPQKPRGSSEPRKGMKACFQSDIAVREHPAAAFLLAFTEMGNRYRCPVRSSNLKLLQQGINAVPQTVIGTATMVAVQRRIHLPAVVTDFAKYLNFRVKNLLLIKELVCPAALVTRCLAHQAAAKSLTKRQLVPPRRLCLVLAESIHANVLAICSSNFQSKSFRSAEIPNLSRLGFSLRLGH